MEYVRNNNNIIKNPINCQENYLCQGINLYNSTVNALKKVVKKVYSEVEAIFNKEETNISVLISGIKKDFESIENILGKSPLYEYEYIKFSSIKDIAFYLLDDSLFSYLYMVIELMDSFYEIIQVKKDKNIEDYELKQEEFSLLLFKHEQKFYTEICKPSEHYNEETLGKITNYLLDL